MIPTELEQLTRHMHWADAVIWRVVLGEDGAASDPRIRSLLHHVHTVQWVYLQLVRHEAVEVPDPDSFPDAGALCRWARAYHAEASVWLASLDAAALDARLEVPWAEHFVARSGEVHAADVRQSILQVASHSTYHRGQVNARVREIGGEPPLTDFVGWVWLGRPDAEWPRDVT